MNAHTFTKPVGANGILPLYVGMKPFRVMTTIIGGPYDAFARIDREQADFGVCVRAERVPDNVSVHLPIRDFSVPSLSDAVVTAALKNAFKAALSGRKVYVGCAGGWGRTGLFLALMAKAAGIADPIEYVRTNYTPRAVETEAQERYVEDFDVTELRKWLKWAGVKAWFFSLFR